MMEYFNSPKSETQITSKQRGRWLLKSNYLQPADDSEDEEKLPPHLKKAYCIYEAVKSGMQDGFLAGVFFGGFWGMYKYAIKTFGNPAQESEEKKKKKDSEPKEAPKENTENPPDDNPPQGQSSDGSASFSPNERPSNDRSSSRKNTDSSQEKQARRRSSIRSESSNLNEGGSTDIETTQRRYERSGETIKVIGFAFVKTAAPFEQGVHSDNSSSSKSSESIKSDYTKQDDKQKKKRGSISSSKSYGTNRSKGSNVSTEIEETSGSIIASKNDPRNYISSSDSKTDSTTPNGNSYPENQKSPLESGQSDSFHSAKSQESEKGSTTDVAVNDTVSTVMDSSQSRSGAKTQSDSDRNGSLLEEFEMNVVDSKKANIKPVSKSKEISSSESEGPKRSVKSTEDKHPMIDPSAAEKRPSIRFRETEEDSSTSTDHSATKQIATSRSRVFKTKTKSKPAKEENIIPKNKEISNSILVDIDEISNGYISTSSGNLSSKSSEKKSVAMEETENLESIISEKVIPVLSEHFAKTGSVASESMAKAFSIVAMREQDYVEPSQTSAADRKSSVSERFQREPSGQRKSRDMSVAEKSAATLATKMRSSIDTKLREQPTAQRRTIEGPMTGPKTKMSRILGGINENEIILSACNCALVLGVVCSVISFTRASFSI